MKYTFAKVFSDESFADKFLNEGLLHMRTVRQFKESAESDPRADKYEGVIGWLQPKDVSLKIDFSDENGVTQSHLIDSKSIMSPVIEQSSFLDEVNIFCLYTLYVPDFEVKYDDEIHGDEERARNIFQNFLHENFKKIEDVEKFGKYVVIILNVKEFLRRINDVIGLKNNIYYKSGFVKYYYPDHETVKFTLEDALFNKRKKYSKECEYRVVFRDESPVGLQEPIIGSLTEIAVKMKISDVAKSISFIRK